MRAAFDQITLFMMDLEDFENSLRIPLPGFRKRLQEIQKLIRRDTPSGQYIQETSVSGTCHHASVRIQIAGEIYDPIFRSEIQCTICGQRWGKVVEEKS